MLCKNDVWNRSSLLFIQPWVGIYIYVIWQAHKAALFQRIEGEDFDCLELALKSYLHVHLIKMTAFSCRHKIREQGEQKNPKKPKKPKSELYLNESDGFKKKKNKLQLHDKTLTLYFPFSPSGPTKTDDLSASLKCQSSASNLNSESIMLDRARAAKTFPTSAWRERTLAQNGSRALTVMPGSISLSGIFY